jgi:ubiquitin carboxyl-terminal hydrolase L5
LQDIGCSHVQLEELWTLDDDSLQDLKDSSGAVHGLIFLFQWQNPSQAAVKKDCLSEDQIPPGLFFAHQVTTNACATQAILSVVLNAEIERDELGSTLTEFKDFTGSFPPSLKGVAISSSESIKKAHNSFSRTDAFLNDTKFVSKSRESEDVFHFVAYIPKNGTVYELDGLQSGPIVVGQYDDTTTATATTATTNTQGWLSVARTAIQERMVGDAIKFNLMAVMQDKRVLLKERLEKGDETARFPLEMEETKRAQWKLENQRRRHNFVPLCVSLLKELAKAGKLEGLVKGAAEKKQQQRDARKNNSTST